MSSFRRILFAALVLGIAGCALVPSPESPAPTRWAHEASDLKPDPDVTWGRLENGLRYAVLPHAAAQRRVSIHLLVQAGSYDEARSERGYAHFVEHLAFREMKDVSGGVFATMEKLGTAHSNGATSFFETNYYFNDLPVDDSATLATGLKVFRAIADGIAFTPQGVDLERGVIFDELRSRDAAAAADLRPDELEYAAGEKSAPRHAELAAIFSGLRLLDRFPNGAEATIRAATASRLQRFYRHWYRPERMIVVIVGDVAPTATADLVRQTFGSLAAEDRSPVPPKPEVPRVPRPGNLPLFADVWDNESILRVTLGTANPQAAPDTLARRRASLVRRLALDMLERRFDRAVASGDAPFFAPELLLSHVVPGVELALVRANAAPPQWTKALVSLDAEIRRAREQGFASTELERAVKAETLRAGALARQAEQANSGELAQALAFSIARNVVFTTPADDRDLTAAQLATVTVEQCQAALRETLPLQKLCVGVDGPFADGTPKLEALAPALNTSRAAELEPYPAPPPLRPFPFTDFGPPGKVVRRRHVDEFDADLIEFGNGVRLNLRRTTFEPGRMRLLLRLDGGRLATPADQPGLDLRTFGWIFGGLRGLTEEELQATLSDRNGSASLTVSGNELRVTQDDDASNLPLLLQVSAAYFSRPAFRAENRSLAYARKVTTPYTVTAAGVAELGMQYRMSGRHPATVLASMDDIVRRTRDELQAWLRPQLALSPLEVSVIGDIDPAVAIDAVARTFGALPARRTTDPYFTERRIDVPVPAFSEAIAFAGYPGVAGVKLAWPLPADVTYAARCRARILVDVLRQRLWQKLRIEQGQTYVMEASVHSDNGFRPNLDYLQCYVEAAPERIAAIASVVDEVAATLARDGLTADELERARQPLVRDAESSLRDNEWLLDLISVAQSDPAYAYGWAHALEDYRTATLEQVNALARNILAPGQRCQLVVRPK